MDSNSKLKELDSNALLALLQDDAVPNEAEVIDPAKAFSGVVSSFIAVMQLEPGDQPIDGNTLVEHFRYFSKSKASKASVLDELRGRGFTVSNLHRVYLKQIPSIFKSEEKIGLNQLSEDTLEQLKHIQPGNWYIESYILLDLLKSQKLKELFDKTLSIRYYKGMQYYGLNRSVFIARYGKNAVASIRDARKQHEEKTRPKKAKKQTRL